MLVCALPPCQFTRSFLHDESRVNSKGSVNALNILNNTIASCRKCPRLVRYRESVARAKRRAFLSWDYWGKPVPGFGDANAQLLIIGLAPAAHGGNRTGRTFTGDRSGDFLFDALYRTGFANQPTSVSRNDGLRLHDAYIGVTVRCAPPANKPLPFEFANCRSYLETELAILRPRAILVLGGLPSVRICRSSKTRASFRAAPPTPSPTAPATACRETFRGSSLLTIPANRTRSRAA